MTDENSKPKTASRNSWQILPMPKWKSRLSLKRSFTQTEFRHLAEGLIPESMDDKWFVFLEDDWLYFHRSWTGACIYQVKLTSNGENYGVAEAWVNRSFKQYKNIFNILDKLFLGFLIDNLLQGKKV